MLILGGVFVDVLIFNTTYSRNVMDVDWGLVVKLALPAKLTRRANKVIGIYDRSP
jgi:hypothetical protein